MKPKPGPELSFCRACRRRYVLYLVWPWPDLCPSCVHGVGGSGWEVLPSTPAAFAAYMDPLPSGGSAMRLFLANAFSLGMLSQCPEAHVLVRRVTPDDARRAAEGATRILNAIRHPATEAVALEVLGLRREDVEAVPAVTLDESDGLLVFLPRWAGGRPPETRQYDISELPESIDIYMVRLLPEGGS